MKKKLFSGLLIVLLFFLFQQSVPATDNSTGKSTDKAAKIDTLIHTLAKNGLINGAVLVAESGKIIYRKAFGIANPEWDIANTIDTRFHIFSISKQFTAALTMKLVEEGKLDLDKTISDYLPYFKKDTGQKVKLHHLMCHTHGIPGLDHRSLPPISYLSTKDWIKKHFSKDFQFQPGTKFRYGHGFDIMAAIIEQVTGKSFEQVMIEKIFKPLNMKNTGFLHQEKNVKRIASIHWESLNRKRQDISDHPANGSSGLYSTVDDLYLWDQALRNNTLLSNASKEKMFTVHASFGRPYGYGWDIIEAAPFGNIKKKIVYHGGGIKTIFYRSIEDGHLVILLNNVMSQNNEIAMEIMRILYHVPYKIVKRPVSRRLYEALKSKQIDEVVKLYYHLKKTQYEKWNFEEYQLKRLGEFLLSIKRYDRAIGIFKVNVKEYPGSANAYDSLAGAYMKKGNNQLAIKNYRKSLELNPKNKNALKMLEKLKK